MHVDEVELRVVRLPYKSVFKTSFGAESEKVAVIATVRSDGVEGYGEGVMDELCSYREESIVGALHLLREALVPSLLNNDCDDPMTLCDSWAGWRGNPMAKTTLELAVWDCHARQLGVPLRTLFAGERTEVPVGASLGMNTVPETVASVGRHVEQGYKRIKLKIEPGWDVDLLTAVRDEFPDIELTVDANSAYTLDHLDVLHKIDGFGLHYIEQPLHWDDLTDHAALAPQMQTALCLDESLTSPARTKAALALGACAVVNVKVGRVGGLAATKRI
ncbi:MAG: o-succinylbenzoate synthase, partial [Ilumatobacteraceae bacterium]